MLNLFPVSRADVPWKSSLGAPGHRNGPGLEGEGDSTLWAGVRCPELLTTLRIPLSWFCSAPVLPRGGLDFISNISQLTVCAPVQDGTGCTGVFLGFWLCPRPSNSITAADWVGMKWFENWGRRRPRGDSGGNWNASLCLATLLPLKPFHSNLPGRVANLFKKTTKTWPEPSYVAGFAPKGVTGLAHRTEGHDTQPQRFVEAAAARPGLPTRLWSASCR